MKGKLQFNAYFESLESLKYSIQKYHDHFLGNCIFPKILTVLDALLIWTLSDWYLFRAETSINT